MNKKLHFKSKVDVIHYFYRSEIKNGVTVQLKTISLARNHIIINSNSMQSQSVYSLLYTRNESS